MAEAGNPNSPLAALLKNTQGQPLTGPSVLDMTFPPVTTVSLMCLYPPMENRVVTDPSVCPLAPAPPTQPPPAGPTQPPPPPVAAVRTSLKLMTDLATAETPMFRRKFINVSNTVFSVWSVLFCLSIFHSFSRFYFLVNHLLFLSSLFFRFSFHSGCG
jgi:hypothetical protein